MSEVRAKKALGQHFLVDLNIARKICDSLSGGEIRLRTAPAVAALPGADGQAAAGRGPEEPETAVIIAAKRGTGNAAETGAAAATGDAAVAVDGRTAEIAAGPDVAAGCRTRCRAEYGIGCRGGCRAGCCAGDRAGGCVGYRAGCYAGCRAGGESCRALRRAGGRVRHGRADAVSGSGATTSSPTGPRSTRKASNTCMRITPNSRRV